MAKKNKKKNFAPTRDENGKKLSRKERKQQRKALLKSQKELEAQLVAEGKIPMRNKYRAKSFFGRAIALCLVFLFGIVATVGAFLGFGAFAPMNDVFWLFGLDSSEFLTEEYGAKGALDLVGDILKDIEQHNINSLGAISKYTPIMDDYLDDIVESLSTLGIKVDDNKLKNTPLDELGAYFQDDVMGNIVLGETLGVKPGDGNGLMMAICYGTEGVDYKVTADGKIEQLPGGTKPVTLGDLTSNSDSLLERVTVEDAFGVTYQSNAAMRFLAYGTEGLNYAISGSQIVMLRNELTGELYQKKKISDLTKDGSTPLETAKISDLITVESGEGLLGTIKDWTIDDLKQSYRIERLRIDEVMDIGDSASPIMQAIKNWRLCDLKDKDKVNTLKLGDIIEIDGDSAPILKALQNTQIGELSQDVDGLRLMDILEEEDISGNEFLRSLKLSPLTSLGDDLKELSAAEVFGDKMYSYLDPSDPYGDGNPQGDIGKSYYQLYKDYETTKNNDPTSSGTKPIARAVAADEKINSYFSASGNGAKLVRGFYTQENGIITAVPEKDVHIRKTTTAAPGSSDPTTTVTYYKEGEQPLTPIYDWRFVDYENSALAALPAGDRISSRTGDRYGYTVVQRAGDPYLDAENDGNPAYYLTTRARFVNGVPSQQTENVAYPLMKDGSGIYYTYLKYTLNGGAAEFSEVRVDLEREIIAYEYGDDNAPVSLTKNADGKWVYTPAGQAEETVVTVYTHGEEKDPASGAVTVPAYDYIKTEIEVHEGYYAAPAEGTTIAGRVYGESEVTEKFEIVKADGTGGAVAVERYLSGVWFFLFGGENEAKNGFTDNSNTPVLDLTDAMSGISETLSDTELWKLFFHDVLKTNPFVDIGAKFPGGLNVGGQGAENRVTNLNQCTLNESVELVKQLVDSTPAQPQQ